MSKKLSLFKNVGEVIKVEKENRLIMFDQNKEILIRFLIFNFLIFWC